MVLVYIEVHMNYQNEKKKPQKDSFKVISFPLIRK